MSAAAAAGDRAQARAVAKTIKDAGAALSGKQRGRDRAVRRDSYDIDDRRAQVFRPVADGSAAGTLGWIDDIVRLAEEFDVTHRKPGERGPLMANGVRVLKEMLRRFLEFRTGKLDPALTALQGATGLSRNAVIGALARLKKHGFLSWIRRSQKTDNEGHVGPQREQATNAYFFELARLPKAVLRRFLDLRERRRRRAAVAPASPASAAPPAAAFADPALASAFDALCASVENAS